MKTVKWHKSTVFFIIIFLTLEKDDWYMYALQALHVSATTQKRSYKETEKATRNKYR